MVQTFSMPKDNHRLGMQYFPDFDHFQESDLAIWLPELKAMGIQWLTLSTPTDRAIPEPFIRGLIKAGIEPVLHFKSDLKTPPKWENFRILLQAYKNWDVRYITLFDKPNLYSQWGADQHSNNNLVNRFLDVFIPLAEGAANFGFRVGFAPLEPGGNYWDTTFIRKSLIVLKEKGHQKLLSQLFLSAYASAGNRPFDWGIGGPEHWPGTRPFHTPTGEEDQFGFRIFDWYNAQSSAILGERLPIMLVACGCGLHTQTDITYPPISISEHSYRNLQIARLLARQSDGIPEGATKMELPENILSGNFSVLSTAEDHSESLQGWYQGNGEVLPIVNKIKAWVKSSNWGPLKRIVSHKGLTVDETSNSNLVSSTIEHYCYISPQILQTEKRVFKKLEKFLTQHQPTIGFSLDEAKMAKKITIVTSKNIDGNTEILQLSNLSRKIKRINISGTVVANIKENI